MLDTGSLNATFCATLVDEWARHGLTDAVICPGSRSTPMAIALAADERISVHVHHDERSGSFMALGLARATGRAAVVLTTSGTAAVQLHAAVVEADLDRVPMLVLTADRPPELHGIGAPQTIDQNELYGRSVRAFIDAGPPDADQRSTWRELARRALHLTAQGAPGPVHLDLPFREPLTGVVAELPPRDDVEAGEEVGDGGADRFDEPDSDAQLEDSLVDLVSTRTGVIIAGDGIAMPDDVFSLAEALGWPVLADPRSGCRVPHPAVIAHGDAILRVDGPWRAPEVVIRLGAPHASKVLSQWLAGLDADQVLVDADGIWRDPEQSATVRVHAGLDEFCRDLLDQQVMAAEPGWMTQWRRADDAAERAIAAVLASESVATEPGVARSVVRSVPMGGSLVVSSSMPIRDVEWFAPAREGLRVHANRGANGIDGVTSTAVGVAAAGGPTALLIGDVALLHDTTGLLGLDARGLDLCIVVIDNDGGGIFSFLPQHDVLEPSRFEQLFGTPHGVDLTMLADAHGLPVLEATDDEAVGAAVAAAFAAGGSHVVLVRTSRERNVVLHERLHAATADAVAAIRVG